MTTIFPKLPDYQFSWRSIQIEPLPYSGERFTLGVLVKGDDRTLIAAKLIQAEKIKKIFGLEFGNRIADALSLCIQSAEQFYSNKDLTINWKPPLEGFYTGKVESSLAENIEDAIFRAAMYCSSFCASMELERGEAKQKKDVSAPESWRQNILRAVTSIRSEYVNYFEKSITIRGIGIPITYGFLSAKYAAQFDAVQDVTRIQQGLIRAQSKLWQLDRLRDEGTLFKPQLCELLLNIPATAGDEKHISIFKEFVEELRYEAAKRDLGVFTSSSASDAAHHVINSAA